MDEADSRIVRKVSSAILFLVSRTVWPDGDRWLELRSDGKVVLMPGYEINTVVAFKGYDDHLFWYENAKGIYDVSRDSRKIIPLYVAIPPGTRSTFINPTFGMCDEEVIMTAKMSGWEEQ
jgi:hypothetical protein